MVSAFTTFSKAMSTVDEDTLSSSTCETDSDEGNWLQLCGADHVLQAVHMGKGLALLWIHAKTKTELSVAVSPHST